MTSSSGFRERPHTADWELEVWAPDPASLLAKSAEGMFALMNIVPDDGCLEERSLELDASDLEGLLVAFLSDLLYILDRENQMCRPVSISLDGYHLSVRLACAGVISRAREIKAVTWHNLAIHQTDDLLRVAIVFDV